MDEQNLKEDDWTKALKTLDSEKCAGLTKCSQLVDLWGEFISSRENWNQIGETIKALASGTKKSADLMKYFNNKKASRDISNAMKILDLGGVQSLSACNEALKSDNNGKINSCRLEALLEKSDLATVKTAIRANPLDMTMIKKNMSENKIAYHLFAGGISTLYPKDAYQSHEQDMGDLLDNSTYVLPQNSEGKALGSEVIKSSEFEKSLN